MTDEHGLKLKIILGSTRPNRFSGQAGKWILDRAKQIPGIEAETLDLRDYEMPFFNETISPGYKQKDYENEAVKRWTGKVDEADGFVIVTPEYNHGYDAVLKNALDYAYKEWNNKPVGFVAYGSVGGARAVEQLRQVAVELQMAPIRNAVHISAHWTLLDEKGSIKIGALVPYQQAADGLLSQMSWWMKALKNARSAQ